MGEDPNHDVIWGQLISAQEGGHLMGASCGGGQMQVNEKAFNDVGLKARHAYSVLDVKMYKNHKLIRLRNPWGKNPWKGPWSDDSAEMKRGNNKQKLKSFVSVSHVFKPGSYLVVPMAFNQYKHDQQMPTKAKLKKMPKFTMTFHSMSQISVDRFYIGTYTIADSLYYLAHKKGTRHEARQGVTVYYLSGGFAGLIVMAENRDSDQFLQIKCNCEDSNNVVATRGELLTMDVIPPMHRQIIVVLSQLEMSNGRQI